MLLNVYWMFKKSDILRNLLGNQIFGIDLLEIYIYENINNISLLSL
jgi:hypothetical protein